MVEYLKHDEIDKGKWDECILKSQLPVVYMMSWYLDIITPQWCALISGDYKAIMPLTWRKKYGIKYIYQSFLAQQSGIFTVDPAGIDERMIKDFFDAIPAFYRYIDYSFNEVISTHLLPGIYEVRKNHILLLNRDYITITNNYSRRCRRNIRKAQECLLRNSLETQASEAVAFFKKHLKEKLPEFNKYYMVIGHLMNICLYRNMGEILTATAPNGEIAGIIFYLFNEYRCTMITCASTATGLKCQTMYYLIDQIIQKFAGKLKELDFFGTNIPSIEYFNESFGVETKYFTRLKINRLPWLLRMIKK